MNLKLGLLLITALTSLVLGIGCSSDSENGDVFAAQDCLNKADESNSADLNKCLDKLGDAAGPQALALRCSIGLMAGGITTSRIAQAFDQQDDSSAGSGALLLTLSYNDNNSGTNDLALAKEALETCERSGQQGLIGIAGFVVTGTAVCQLGCNISSPSQITASLQNCANNNSCDKESIGIAAVSIADNYCASGQTDSEVCDDFSQAVANNTVNGVIDYEAIANAALANLQN